MKTYRLNPNITFQTLPDTLPALKPRDKDSSDVAALVQSIAPAAKAQPIPLTPVPRAIPSPQTLPKPALDPAKPLLKLGLDVHLDFTMAVAQKDHANPQAPRKFTLEQLVARVKQWVDEGFQVFCVQESCGFGFTLHRQLVAAGAQSFLITPIALNGPRKTDRLDARALCLRLSRWLDGNRDELSPIRIPSEAEQRRRETTRRRKFLQRLIRMLGNRGHGQVAEYQHLSLPSRWWGRRNWPKLQSLDPWLRGQLESLRELIVTLEAQVRQLEDALIARVQGQERPKGLGEVTLVTLDSEVCDWGRFYNRKQVGSYTGSCPSEHSSGGKRRMGSIDRMGNGKVRTLLVEAVWRFLKWQPGWKAALKMKRRLGEGAAIRKKTVVALARQLAIDLWRWRTGRCTLADLGWIPV